MDTEYRAQRVLIEQALDDILALYGEKRRLSELRRINRAHWERRQRMARVKLVLLSVGVVGAFTTAGAGALIQAPAVTQRHPILEWWPVLLGLAAVIGAFAVLRQSATQTAIELAKKADREVIDIKFAALEKNIETRFDSIKAMIEGLRQTVSERRGERRDSNRDAS